MRGWRRTTEMALLLLFVLPGPAWAQDSSSASFAQLPGRDGCVRALGAVSFDFEGDPLTGCATASAIGNPRALVLSPDERQLLVAAGGGASGSNAVVSLDRASRDGALTFTSCVSDDGGDGRVGSDGVCADGDGLSGAAALATTSDGRMVFVTSRSSSSLTWFARDLDTGRLTQQGCLKHFAWPGERCTTAPLLSGASGVAVSPDGRLVFVTAAGADSLSAYRRDPSSGALERVSCVSDTGSDGLCENVSGLRGARDVVISPDGRTVLVVAPTAGAVTAYEFDAGTGDLSQTACLSDRVAEGGRCDSVSSLGGATSLAMTADGRDVYVGAREDSALTALRRRQNGSFVANGCFVHQFPQPGDAVFEDELDPEEIEEEQEFEAEEREANGTARCATVRALDPAELAVSADGRALFAAGDDYLSVFRRDRDDGRLEWMACAEEERSYKTCVQARGLPGGSALATSSDGRSLYVASNSSHSVAVFAAAVAVGARATVSDRGRARVLLRCPSTRPLPCRGVLRHPLLRSSVRYRLARGGTAYAAVRLERRAARRVSARRLSGIVVSATDASGFTSTMRRHVALASRR